MQYASLQLKLEHVGLLQYLQDEDIVDVAIHYPLKISLLSSKKGRLLVDAPNATKDNLLQLGHLLANKNGLRLNHENPTMSIQLPTGERVQYSMPPATHEHITITVRRYSEETKSIDELAHQGTFSSGTWLRHTDYSNIENLEKLNAIDRSLVNYLQIKDVLNFFKLAVQQRKNILISGQTGSGKTYFTRALIAEVPRDELIITIEDVRELFLHEHKHQINFIFGKGQDRCTAKQALTNCMRSTPDRIFLAEVRGDEASDYIEALNTGHPGSITSTHANNAKSAYNRIAKLIKKSEGGDIHDILDDVYNAIDISVYYKNRQVDQIFFDPLYVMNKI
jgi:type IV secretion system protein VirB11